jgi:hypothetical protein
LTAAASGGTIVVDHSSTYDPLTGSLTLIWKGLLPSWAATVNLLTKWATNVGFIFSIDGGTLQAYLNTTLFTSSSVFTLVDGTVHELCARITPGTVNTTVDFSLDGVALGVQQSAANPGSLSTTATLRVQGNTSSARYAGTCIHAYTLNFAPTAAEVLDMYRNGIPESWKWGSQTELQVNGNFDSVTTGWTAGHGTLASIAGGQSGNCLEITRTDTSQQYAYGASIAIGAVKKFRLSVYVKSGSSGNEAFSGSVYDGGTILAIVAGTSSGTWTKYSVEGATLSTTTSIYVLVAKDTATAGTMLFDTISVVQLGATLALGPESWQTDKPYDLSSNNLTVTYPATGWSLTRPATKKVMQPTPTDGSTGAVTVTIAMILNGIISGNPSAARAYTFEAGATSDAVAGQLTIDRGYEWTVINTNATYAITVTASAGHTIIGNPIVALSTSGRFLTRKTAASTFVTYRLS